ncbi:MAG: hypothetical protein ACW99Q_10475 [Candidatus Kariarchaeaceae archaeon]|jgi:hypothetical protein
MKNAFLISTGLSVIALVVAGVVIQPNLPFEMNQNDRTNLTSDDAISIALKDGKALSFVRQNQALSTANYDVGIWTVTFEALNQESNFVQVKIDDETELILSSESSQDTYNLAQDVADQGNIESNNPNQNFGVQEDAMFAADYRYGLVEDYYYIDNQEQVEAAIEYFSDIELVKDVINEHSLEFYGYSYENVIYLWGYNYNLYDNWMNVIILAEDIDDNSWNFEISEISASFIFGAPTHTFDDIIEIAEASEEFIQFKENVTEYDFHTILFYSVNNEIGDYTFNIHYSPHYNYFGYEESIDAIAYAEEVREDDGNDVTVTTVYDETETSTEPYIDYYYYWIEIVISDKTGLIVNVWGPDSAILTSDEVVSLVKSTAEIDNWLSGIGSVQTYAYYDGYGNWWVSMYDTDDYYNYAYAGLNDRTLEISDINTFLAISPILSEQDIEDILKEYDGAQEFFDTVSNYEFYAYFDHYGKWYVSLYDIDNYFNYLWGSITDNDGSIIYLEVRLYQEPKLSESAILNILSSSGLDEFKQLYPDTTVSVYYNGYDTWYVYGSSLTLIDAWFWAQIDDGTSDLINFEDHHPDVLPIKDTNEILSITHSTSEYKETVEDTDQFFEYLYFYDGVWYYYLQGTSDDETYYWLSITINDQSGEIIDIWSSSWIYKLYYEDPDDSEYTSGSVAEPSRY